MHQSETKPRELLSHSVEGKGPPVVLLHPVGLDRTCWDAIAGRFSERYRLIRVDLRGHGGSSLPQEGYTLADYADDVHDVLVALGAQPAAIVGLSFGGMVAQTLALRHPADARACVFAGTSSWQDDARRLIALQRADAAAGGMAPLVEPTLQRWFTPEFMAAGGGEKTRKRLLTDDPKGWATAWRAMADLNTAPHLATITVPALCLAGEGDLAVPTVALESMAAAIPQGRFAVLPKASHMMQIECADAFADVVLGFLDEVHRPGARPH